MNKSKLFTFSISTLLTCGILIAVNILLHNSTTTFDFTKDHNYTLSSSTKDLLHDIKDTIHIRAYLTENLPSGPQEIKEYITNMVKSYQHHGDQKIQVTFIDPSTPELEQEAQKKGIIPLQFDRIENDSYTAKRGYLGVQIQYGEKEEIIGQFTKLTGFEYELTSHIRKITSEQLPTLALLTGFGNPEITFDRNKPKSIEGLIKQLQNQYIVVSWSAKDQELPKDTKAIMIVGVTSDISQEVATKIEKALEQGTHLFVAQNYIDIDTSNGITGKELEIPVLKSLLEKQGIQIEKGLVADEQNQTIPVSIQQGMFIMQQRVPFPLIPLIKQGNNTIIDADITPLIVPFTSGITSKEGTPLIFAQSSNKSNLYTQNTYPITTPEKFLSGEKKSFPLGIALEKQNHKIVAIASSMCVIDQLQIESCVRVALNSIDWIMNDAQFSALRNKGTKIYTLQNVTDEKKTFFRVFILLIPSSILIIFGLIYALRRNRRAR